MTCVSLVHSFVTYLIYTRRFNRNSTLERDFFTCYVLYTSYSTSRRKKIQDIVYQKWGIRITYAFCCTLLFEASTSWKRPPLDFRRHTVISWQCFNFELFELVFHLVLLPCQRQSDFPVGRDSQSNSISRDIGFQIHKTLPAFSSTYKKHQSFRVLLELCCWI